MTTLQVGTQGATGSQGPAGPQGPPGGVIVHCGEHDTLMREHAQLMVLFQSHTESVQRSLDTILRCLQGQPGAEGLTDRVTRLETNLTNFRTSTDENIKKLVAAVEGKDGNGGVVGRLGKLERGWALFVGVAVASGAAGAGFAKLLAVLT